MAISTFVRSSSLNGFSFCEMQWFLTYNLGLQSSVNKKADKGSAVHKVMEELAIIKKTIQDNPDTKFIFVGDKVFNIESLFEIRRLTDDEVYATNKARSSKTIYKSDCAITRGHSRMGEIVVEELISQSAKYYADKCCESWTRADFRDVREWTWIVLDYLDGEFDPRKQRIVCPEQPFNISLEYLPWSAYEYNIAGEIIKGFLKVKGTIDLVTEISSDTVHVIDYKSGQRKDWATGEEKTLEYLKNDKQLMLYSWAVRKIFPQYKHVLITIFFIRDGGPYTVPFEPETDKKVEEILRKHFEQVQGTTLPSMCHPQQLDYKCTALCYFYKNNWPGSNKNICKYIHDEIKNSGIEKTIAMHKDPSHVFDKYQEPGA